MPRRSSSFSPSTVLGVAVAARRGARTQAEAAIEAGVTQRILSTVERGTHEPSTKTALALARWLGWSVEQVLEAAEPTNLQSR